MSAFRDRAAIALLAHHNEGTALIRAQKMAEEACVKWGHDCATFYTETGSPHGHIGSPCKRCGAPAGRVTFESAELTDGEFNTP